jgi:hypothetical protein
LISIFITSSVLWMINTNWCVSPTVLKLTSRRNWGVWSRRLNCWM